jgi:4'-phosphopantetheinyl transferase
VYFAVPERQGGAELERAWALLDGDERQRAERLVATQDRHAFVVAHALLRQVLARTVVARPADLRFTFTANGRPELVQDRAWATVRFSLSHSRGLVGCAVTRSYDVGFDIEGVKEAAPLEVAQRAFAHEELAALRALGREERDDRFYALWTLKESYLKGRGLGLSLPLASFAIEPSANGEAHFTRGPADDDVHAWSLHHWHEGSHRAALAVRDPARRITLRRFPDQRIEPLT